MNEVPNSNAIGLRSLPRRQVTLTMVGVILAMFLSSMDQTVVGTAMPKIVAELGGFSHYTWLTTAYLLTSTIMLPITGKFTDMYGRKWFFMSGIAIFLVGSVLSGLSNSMLQIILARGFQGIGAGVIMANSFSVIGDLYPPAERGKIQGLMAAVFGLSSIIGPTLGGWVADTFTWHWVFYINVPVGAFTVGLFVFFYPHIQPDTKKHSIDWAGLAALVIAVVPLLLAVSLGGVEYPWGSGAIIGMLGLALIGFVAFPLIESKASEPIIPLSIFKNSIVSIALVATFFSGVGMFGGIVFIPLFFQGVLGSSATSSGSFLTPMMLGVIAGSAVAGQFLARSGHYKSIGGVGLALIALGMFLLSTMNVHTSYSLAVINIVLVGIGLGITFPIYTIAVQNAVPYEVLGTATSTVPFFRSIGGSVGLAIFGSILTSRFAAQFMAKLPEAVKAAVPQQALSSVTGNAQALLNPAAQSGLKAVFDRMGQQGAELYQQTILALKEALSSGLSEVFIIGGALVVVAFIVNLFIKEIPLRKTHDIGVKEGTPPPCQ